MAYLPLLKLTTKRDDNGEADVLRIVAGITVRDVTAFLFLVATHVGKALDRTPTEARAMFDFDLGDEADCRPIGTGSRTEGEAELGAFARIVAAAIAPVLADKLVAVRGAA